MDDLGPDVVKVTVGGSPQRQAVKRRRKYYCTYNDDWCALHPEYRPWLRKLNESTAQCLLCHQSFSVKYEGRRAVRGHADCTRHKEAVKNRGRPAPPPPPPPPAADSAARQAEARENLATAAELAEIYRGVTQHLSYSSLDGGGQQLLRRGWGEDAPEAPWAAALTRPVHCGRTKAASLTENVLAPHSRELLLDGLRAAGCFSLSADASNRGGRTYLPVAVRYFDRARGLRHGLLDCYRADEAEGPAAGEGLADRLEGVLREGRLDGSCLSAYVADGTSVDAEKHAAAYLRLRQRHGTALQVACRCRLMHDCVRKGLKALSFDVEWLVLKVCGELSSSSSASSAEGLRGFSAFLQREYKELLRRAPVRWLSLLPAVGQLACSWEALRAHFLAAGEEECAGVVWQAFAGPDPLPLCYVHFAHHLMSAFHTALAQLEKPEASCLELDPVLAALLAKLRRRRADRFYGQACQASLSAVAPAERQRFEEEAGGALSRCLEFLEQRYGPADAALFGGMAALSLDREVSWAELEALARALRLPLDLDRLHDELCALHRLQAQTAAKEPRLDRRWVEVFRQLPPDESGQLFRLVSFVLSIPVSNGYCERVFRLMATLWSKERNRLSERLVKAELQVQLNYSMTCAQFYQYVKDSPDLLKAARSQLKYRFKKKRVTNEQSPQQPGNPGSIEGSQTSNIPSISPFDTIRTE
ncbi:uncharacterized protein LOC119960426 [Scyliorhinus canicula]|uniref:uncharacterized protein LOC119960426 n=1 Tax=Scyliorhinus canicula TaxID=7830 RepID=UPI0018F2927E|nr:uncharacterized protein LOC119960426 [Scyliorhinus canicula]